MRSLSLKARPTFLTALKISVYGPCAVKYLLVEYGVYWYVDCKHREFGAHLLRYAVREVKQLVTYID